MVAARVKLLVLLMLLVVSGNSLFAGGPTTPVTFNDITGTVGIANGGTGATTASAARVAIGVPAASYFSSVTTTNALVSGSTVYATYSAELGDPLGEFNPATGIFTAGASGWYIFFASVTCDGSTSGVRQFWFEYSVGPVVAAWITGDPDAEGNFRECGSAFLYMSAGSTMKFATYQNSGGPLNCAVRFSGGRLE